MSHTTAPPPLGGSIRHAPSSATHGRRQREGKERRDRSGSASRRGSQRPPPPQGLMKGSQKGGGPPPSSVKVMPPDPLVAKPQRSATKGPQPPSNRMRLQELLGELSDDASDPTAPPEGTVARRSSVPSIHSSERVKAPAHDDMSSKSGSSFGDVRSKRTRRPIPEVSVTSLRDE
eukprot:Sspe_Gene.107227::Locus_85327_Transcript_1_1_Confidence_1.000_Length_637::g.107227::m.107227